MTGRSRPSGQNFTTPSKKAARQGILKSPTAKQSSDSPAANSVQGGIERFSDLKARRAREHWLDRVASFEELEVDYDSHDGILWCHMDPKDRPSVTQGLVREGRELQGAVKGLFGALAPDEEAPIRYMVWCSKVPGVFNLGGDLRLFAQLIRDNNRDGLIDYAVNCIDVVFGNIVSLDLPVLTVSLVEGDALGGGFEKALSTNVTIAERGARFGLPEVLFGLFPGMGAYSLIARRLGAAKAKRMVMSGRIFSADELFELGLIDLVVEDGQGREAVYDFISQNNRRHAAVRAIHQVEQRVQPLTYEEMHDIALLWVDTAMTLDEANLKKMERLAAAQDRRRAVRG
ncbi:MAG: crotonase/enoyl-CoA hydratase family protein [Pseudomonadota bacterium]